MFGHLPELLIIMVVALIVFGPEKLPEVASTVGKAVRDVRQAFDQAMNPEEEPVDFDAYYREYEALHPDLGAEPTEMWPGVSGTESIELAAEEHVPEPATLDHADGAHPASVPVDPTPSEPPDPA